MVYVESGQNDLKNENSVNANASFGMQTYGMMGKEWTEHRSLYNRNLLEHVLVLWLHAHILQQQENVSS